MSAGKCSTNSAILKYLTESNRPYSVNDIVNNLHKEYGKAAVIKALEALVENGKVVEKIYGKQKVYIRDQSDLSVPCELLSEMDTRINQLSQKLKELQDTFKQSNTEFDALNSSLSVKQLNEKIEFCEKQNSGLKVRADQIKEKVGNTNTIDFNSSHDEMKRRKVAWNTRKRIANTLLSALMDGCPTDKKALMEEIGVEEDN
ncbi:homologous-pairing protein 2-like protein [Leptotrombidium deliense]|uniref:Homologous-pairing protein 2-like protein n=1 Tax=Leptotrombidium deliense TaxID=299467 RepID=A0A443SB89_9ACAR|nr:homologous-pairing protein 2-like protein [Leptotrombidium deliense]